MSWDTLNELQDKLDNLEGKSPVNARYCALVGAVFDNENGKKLVDAWKDMILNQTTFDPLKPKEAIYISEGQHNFIRHILASLKLYQKKIGQ